MSMGGSAAWVRVPAAAAAAAAATTVASRPGGIGSSSSCSLLGTDASCRCARDGAGAGGADACGVACCVASR